MGEKKYMNISSRLSIERDLDKRKWIKAQRTILTELKRKGNDAWLLTRLSRTYFQEGVYKKAEITSRKAVRLAPKNPEVLWDYGEALYVQEKFAQSVLCFRKILRADISSFAIKMGYHKNWISTFKNACRFKIAFCYLCQDKLVLSLCWLRKYLHDCVIETPEPYPQDYVKKKIDEITALKNAIANHEQRLWISLLEIRIAKKDKRIKYKKGFTNGLVIAKSHRQALTLLSKSLQGQGYKLVAAENTEEFDRRCLKTEVPETTRKLARQVRRDKMPRFTDFCMYKSKY